MVYCIRFLAISLIQVSLLRLSPIGPPQRHTSTRPPSPKRRSQSRTELPFFPFVASVEPLCSTSQRLQNLRVSLQQAQSHPLKRSLLYSPKRRRSASDNVPYCTKHFLHTLDLRDGNKTKSRTSRFGATARVTRCWRGPPYLLFSSFSGWGVVRVRFYSCPPRFYVVRRARDSSVDQIPPCDRGGSLSLLQKLSGDVSPQSRWVVFVCPALSGEDTTYVS